MIISKKAILPKGFQASAVASGIRRKGKLDLALFYSQVPAKAACLFTANKIKAAPVLLDKAHLQKTNFFQAIIANSGNANCFTGSQGMRAAKNTALGIASLLKIKNESVLVASTGIIGKQLPEEKINKALPKLAAGLSREGIHKATLAIMTTDTFAKEVTAKFNLGNKAVTVCGIAKGAGMIVPNMATMLAFIFTDAYISLPALNHALKTSVAASFNCITVDGCMSTNDTVAILANSAAGNKIIENGKNFALFNKALGYVCLELAKMIVKDGEGASKFIRIKVSAAKNFQEAKKIGLSIANSNLFKTAIFGENANFGRIAAAAGAAGVEVEEKGLKIKVSPLHKKEIDVNISLERGKSSCTVYTSDLTPEYIKINAEYN